MRKPTTVNQKSTNSYRVDHKSYPYKNTSPTTNPQLFFSLSARWEGTPFWRISSFCCCFQVSFLIWNSPKTPTLFFLPTTTRQDGTLVGEISGQPCQQVSELLLKAKSSLRAFCGFVASSHDASFRIRSSPQNTRPQPTKLSSCNGKAAMALSYHLLGRFVVFQRIFLHLFPLCYDFWLDALRWGG